MAGRALVGARNDPRLDTFNPRNPLLFPCRDFVLGSRIEITVRKKYFVRLFLSFSFYVCLGRRFERRYYRCGRTERAHRAETAYGTREITTRDVTVTVILRNLGMAGAIDDPRQTVADPF